MGLSLSFTVDPPTPFHSLQFHLNRGSKQKLYDPEKGRLEIQRIISELHRGIKGITKLPEYFSICILPSKLHALSLLQHIHPPCTIIYPGLASDSNLSRMQLTDSGISERMAFPGKLLYTISKVKKGSIICADTDLLSGYRFVFQDLLTVKQSYSDIHLCMDVSTSFANFDYDPVNVDSFLFNSDFVFGLKPGITILAIKSSLFKSIREDWKHLFHRGGPVTSSSQSEIICHQEVDILRLFAFMEMCKDLVRRDMRIIANEITYKSILLYHALDASASFEVMINEERDRSPNIICAKILKSIDSFRLLFRQQSILMDELFFEGNGYRVRFGNFPVHSKEQVAYLTDCIALH